MTRNLVRRCGQVAAMLLLLSACSSRAADGRNELEAFRKKVAEEEAKQAPESASRDTQVAGQLRMLADLLARDNDDRAIQVLESIRASSLPPPLQEEWQRVSGLVSKEIERGKAERLEKWATAVDQLVNEVKTTCLEAKVAGDLDAMMLRCSTLQMQANRRTDLMTERLNYKIQGVVHTLSGWAKYLDFQVAGDAQRANGSLRGLIADSSGFPVLAVKEIETRMMQADAQMDVATALANVFAEINTPDDLPTALERLESYSRKQRNENYSRLKTEAQRISAYIDAWKMIQSRDVQTALAALNRYQPTLEEAQRYLVPIKAQIEARIVKGKVGSWTNLPQNPGETTHDYLGRVMVELKDRSEYATILDVMAFTPQIDRSPVPLFSTTDRQAIEQFIAGQRFEKVGDNLAAVTSYRIVIGLSQARYSPVEKAAEALKRLQEKSPEAFKSYEGVVLEQIRALIQQLQILQNRPPGIPNRPY